MNLLYSCSVLVPIFHSAICILLYLFHSGNYALFYLVQHYTHYFEFSVCVFMSFLLLEYINVELIILEENTFLVSHLACVSVLWVVNPRLSHLLGFLSFFFFSFTTCNILVELFSIFRWGLHWCVFLPSANIFRVSNIISSTALKTQNTNAGSKHRDWINRLWKYSNSQLEVITLLFDKTVPGEMQHKYLLTPR